MLNLELHPGGTPRGKKECFLVLLCLWCEVITSLYDRLLAQTPLYAQIEDDTKQKREREIEQDQHSVAVRAAIAVVLVAAVVVLGMS